MSACEINQVAWKHEQDVGTVHWSGRARCEISTFMSFGVSFSVSFFCVLHCCAFTALKVV